MDPALVPHTAAGRQLAWLMSLQAAPSDAQIGDHLDSTAVVDVAVDSTGPGTPNPDLASALLAFGTVVRDLPGAVTRSEDGVLRFDLERGARRLSGMVSIDGGGGGRIGMLGLSERRAEDETESDRVRLVYDRVSGVYEELGAEQAHFWDRARAWLKERVHDGDTVLDVGCGPGHLVADLPPAVRVIGCDMSPEMVRLAARARPSGSFVVHDYHQPFPERWPRADVTIVLGCLEFCADLGLVLRNLAAATEEGGRLLLTVPRMAAQREITLQFLPVVEITMRLWADADVETACAAADLEVIAHDVGPGWSAPDVGTVEYGYWELQNASAHVATT